MSSIENNLSNIHTNIHSACVKSGRVINDITLVAVSKNFPSKDIECAMKCGQVDFGENKLQEAEQKILSIQEELRWHYLGKIQRNKVGRILKYFPVIHSLDSLALALYMDQVAGRLKIKPQVFLQVNLGMELSKNGFASKGIIFDFNSLIYLENLTISGLMCIPPVDEDVENSRKWFIELRDLKEKIESKYNYNLPYLSMGMSSDYEIAIEEGATHVRVGSSIFGERFSSSEEAINSVG